MQQPIYRKVALERLSSPEQLDQLVRVTSIRSWQILLVVGLILAAAILWGVFGTITTKVEGKGVLFQENLQYLMNVSNGYVASWKVAVGDTISVGQTVATLSSPDHISDVQIISPFAGNVESLNVGQFEYVAAGEPLLTVASSTTSATRLKMVVYIPLTTSIQVAPGMEAQCLPLGMSSQENGYLRGTVEFVSAKPVTTQEVLRRTGNTVLTDQLQVGDNPIEVVVALDPDQGGQGYSWSLPQRSPKSLAAGMLCNAEIITSKQAPINLIFGGSTAGTPVPTMPATQNP